MTTARPTLTTIVATIGPASSSPEMIRRLIEAGVSVFRLNFSHGKLEDHANSVAAVRAAAKLLGKPTAILGDLQGPKIRLGTVPGDGIEVAAGQDVLLCCGAPPSPASAGAAIVVPCEYPQIASEVKAGERVLVNDGAIRMLAVERAASDPSDSLRCRAVVGGLLSSRKGINLPDSDISASAITERDWECVHWAVQHGLDFLALSFVRRAEEVKELRRAVAGMCSVEHDTDASERGAAIPVVAKIEKPQALACLDEIVQASDAIMVARGDLGVEMDLAQVPLVQKRIIAAASEWGKPCIVATQMLETMIQASTPTRAEVSDVANAVLDGADAVMLSGETAVGRHPALVVETMRRVLTAAEGRLAELTREPSPGRRLVESKYRTAALAHGAWYVARDLGARLVVCWSQRGGTARYLSQNGFSVPIVAYSSDVRELRRMALLRGVLPLRCDAPPAGADGCGGGLPLRAWQAKVEQDLLKHGWAAPGDPVILVAGSPLGEHGATTAVAVHYLGNPVTGFGRFE